VAGRRLYGERLDNDEIPRTYTYVGYYTRRVAVRRVRACTKGPTGLGRARETTTR